LAEEFHAREPNATKVKLEWFSKPFVDYDADSILRHIDSILTC